MDIGEGAPRHGHRTPAEIAEDEVVAALRGDGYDVLGTDGAMQERSRFTNRVSIEVKRAPSLRLFDRKREGR